MSAAGLQTLAIGLGRPEHAARYCGKLAPSQTCFASESNDPYTAWGLRRGKPSEFARTALSMMRATVKAMANGQTQGETTGDVQMMPGTFIVDSDGIIRYAYYSQYAGDDPEISVLLDAAASLAQDVAR